MLDRIIHDDEAMIAIYNALIAYTSEFDKSLDECISKIKSTNSDWNDENYDNLMSAVSSFMADSDAINKTATQIKERIESKIEAVRELHSKKI